MIDNRIRHAVRRPSSDPIGDFWQRIRVGLAVFVLIVVMGAVW